jgi:ketosteroid isomerase-like protein
MNGKKLMAIFILTLLLFNLTGCISQELTDEDLIENLIDTWVEGYKEKDLDKYMGVYSPSLIIEEQDGEENTLETYDYVEKYSRLKDIFDADTSISAVTNAVNVLVSGLVATATFFVDYEITSTIDDIESTDKWSEYVVWTLDKGWGSWSVNYEIFQKLP